MRTRTSAVSIRKIRIALFVSLLVIAAALLLLPAGVARAQDFGQNKVQYKKLEWAILTTEHFDVYFYKGEREAAIDAARMAERAYRRLSTILGHEIANKIPLILYASQSDFQSTNITPDMVSEGTGGFTDFSKRRVTIPFTGGYADLEHVLTHELVHAFQVDMLFGSADKGISNSIGGYSPPLWFMEGMAEYLSITTVDNLTQMWMRDASLEGYLIPIETLEFVGDIRVYRFGQSIFAYIGKTFGDERIGEILKRVARTRSTGRAFQDVLGITLAKLSEDWTDDVRKTYLPKIRDHQKPDEFARRLTDSDKDMSNFHLAPAISPEGDRMVFISDRTLYNDLYLASALDGRIEKRIVKGERAEAFESLRFLNASIDFSPNRDEIVFSAKAGARDAIYIERLRDGRVLRRIEFPLDGIVNPSFSPDGEWIVFVGLMGGRSDLFRCRADGSRMERLTNDRYLALSPQFSPDGKSILFVTDQDSTTDFDRLIFAKPRLAMFDIQTRAVRVLPGMAGMNTAPFFFPDGRHLLYISDRTGIANIFVRDLDTQTDAQITDILTGVTGVIPLAPAMSLSRDGRRVVFSAFRRGNWDLFAIKDPLDLAAGKYRSTPVEEPPDTTIVAEGPRDIPPSDPRAIDPRITDPRVTDPRVTDPGSAPGMRAASDPPSSDPPASAGDPAPVPDSAMARALREFPPGPEGKDGAERPRRVAEVFSSIRDLPDTTGFKIDRYRVHFTIDYARASGFFGSNVGAAAQTTLNFSDVLGNHELHIGANVFGSISDSDFLLRYDNLANRINYGIALYQFRDDFFLSTAQTNDNYVSQIYRGGQFILSRPFNRFRRIDLSLEGLQVDESVYEQAFYNGYFYDYRRADRGKLYFIRPGISYVHDNALWGITGPISGGRSQYTFDHSIGDVSSNRFIVDRRSYWNLNQKYTFALRAVGATSAGRNPQIFRIGGPYTLHGFSYGELEGNHVGLMNVEFRFPLIQTLELGWPLPVGLRWIRGALFFDSGAAWYDTRRFRGMVGGGLDDIRASYGIGAAINLGFAVIRWDLAQPTNLHHNVGKSVGSISFGGDF
jgi:Tol biopolymer transport system component